MSTTAIAMNGLMRAEYFDFESTLIGDTFRIFVAKPHVVKGQKYPAIFVLDGNTLFAQVMGIQQALAYGAELPAAYVIGMGYPTERGFMEAFSKRNRDYVPTDGDAYAQKVLGCDAAAGGQTFLRFLIEELKPELEARYAVDAHDATVIGWSLGGLFAAWTLLNAPEAFQRYILATPSIWWNNEEAWQWEQVCATKQKDIRANVFVSAGGLEYPEAMRKHSLQIAERNPELKQQMDASIAWYDQHGWPRTTELTQQFADKLLSRNYAGLKLHCQNLPDESHMSVGTVAISRGLRYVFDHWRP